MKHNCLKGPRSKCRGCIEDQARASARMRGSSDWKSYLGEAKLIVAAAEKFHAASVAGEKP